MLQIRELHYHIGERRLLDGAEWMIQPGKRFALVGPNGVGKTTLLRILTGEIESTSGSIIKPRGYKIGYLPQEELEVRGTNILETVLEGQDELNRLEEKIKELHHQMADIPNPPEEMLEQLGILEHRFHVMDGYHLETQAKSILSGLGFKREDFGRPMSEFSGGWRMRVYLALLLVLKPDLLLLDEPTNHLDIPSLEWLESYLLSFPGSVVSVSHDRFFIDRIAQEIVELDRGRFKSYPGNYHKYESLKEERDALQLKKWKEQQNERQRQEKFVNRFRYKNTKAKQVQSRLRQLEKMETLEVDAPSQLKPNLDFKISVDVTSYNDVLTIKDMSFKYTEEWVLANNNLDIYRGEKVSLVGPNGVGKTTLTRLISQQLKPQKGSVKLGERTVIGYYAQHQVDALDLDATVYEEVASTVATGLIPKIRDIMGIFQFTGEDVYKKIRVLSGGEKARVSLAKILISPVNFLIMDEPTNHLDKVAREALERALSHYNGTLVLISHDRYFLDKLVERVIEIRDGQLLDYDGNYSEYLQKRDANELRVPVVPGREDQAPPPPGAVVPQPIGSEGLRKTKEQKRQEAAARQAISKERNKYKKIVRKAEEEIDKLEIRKSELEALMAKPETFSNGELMVKYQKEYAVVTRDLEKANQLWEESITKLEELEVSIV